jgi:hypothetical protein
MGELHAHCQCDNCSGADCGQDDPEAQEIYQAGIKLHDDAVRNKALNSAIDAITAKLDDRDRNWKGMQKAIKIIAELKEDPEKEAAPVGDAL